MDKIVIATVKEWNIRAYFDLKERFENRFEFHLITHPDELKSDHLEKLNPKYIFFPHWSWIIPEEIFENFECIAFHMTDLPFGRGGSPLQNLLVRGIYKTKISAFRVDRGIDSGDIYLKEPFDLSRGSAEEIFMDVSKTIFEEMIPRLLGEAIQPVSQKGEPVFFKRRKPEASDLSALESPSMVQVYDFVRMLDAEGYPKAFVRLGNLKVMLSGVHRLHDRLVGKFEVMKNG